MKEEKKFRVRGRGVSLKREREAARLREAVRLTDESLAVLGRGGSGYLFSVQRMVLADTDFTGVARELIAKEGYMAEEAVCEAAWRLQNRLSGMKNVSMRRHSQDVEAVRRRVLCELGRQTTEGCVHTFGILPLVCPPGRDGVREQLPPR